ncbi:MAG TPA: Gfo/Idh/MocA family oxidoreductase [Firmicutes bacterium]|nr:Gfo/Idh/MocA family oxidoreductase [Bacillota bacterium]HHY97210.1 Gfo/Idh/MocA family oxidoreductase [Bacillota bacterium]
MSDNKLRVGVIGCGAIARNAHLPSYAKLRDLVTIQAVADVHEGRAMTAAELYNVPEVYTDYRDMLAKADIDAVSVCTPNSLHAQQTIDAINAGKHVLCEKPMATSLEDSRAMIDAAKQAGVTLMVGFTHRYFNFNRKVREYIQKGLIGQPMMMRVRFAHNGPYLSWSAMSDWFFKPEMAGGGALLDMGIHAIDLCRYFGGDVTSISAKTATLGKDISVEDWAVGIMEFKDPKLLAYFEVGWSSQAGPLGVEIYGSEGTIVADYVTPLKIYKTKTDLGKSGWILPDDVGGGGWDAEVANFVRALLGREELLATAEDGYESLRIALAAYESSKKGVRVAL